MPKRKTRKGVAKRFKLTKKGRIKKAKAFKGHLLTHKSRKRKRALSKKDMLYKKEAQKVKRML